MIPIQDLLNRIRWDQEFAKGNFKIGYYDRIEDKVIVIPLQQVLFPEQDHYTFQVMDPMGEIHRVPLHRVRDVYKDGELIWHRKHFRTPRTVRKSR